MNRRQTKECIGCGDHFLTFKNYDYCADCAINNNRYLNSSNCSECDGSGMIKFRKQKPRPCKLCTLTKQTMTKKTKPKLAKLTPEEQFWTTVDEQAKYKIYEILARNIPLQNVKPILENWRYEDRQTKLVGLFLEKDVDFRTIESDLESQYEEEELPTPDYLSQELTYHYLRAVVKGIITSLSAYDCHDPAWWENLTEN